MLWNGVLRARIMAGGEDHWELEVMRPRRWTEMGVWGKMHLDAAKNGRSREQVHGGSYEKADTRHDRRRKRCDGARIDGRGGSCTGAGTAVRSDQGYRSRFQLSIWDGPRHGRGDKRRRDRQETLAGLMRPRVSVRGSV